jgi:hypothetical protein
MNDMKNVETTLVQIRVTKEVDEILRSMADEYPNKISKSFIANTLLEGAIKRGDVVSITNKNRSHEKTNRFKPD